MESIGLLSSTAAKAVKLESLMMANCLNGAYLLEIRTLRCVSTSYGAKEGKQDLSLPKLQKTEALRGEDHQNVSPERHVSEHWRLHIINQYGEVSSISISFSH